MREITNRNKFLDLFRFAWGWLKFFSIEKLFFDCIRKGDFNLIKYCTYFLNIDNPFMVGGSYTSPLIEVIKFTPTGSKLDILTFLFNKQSPTRKNDLATGPLSYALNTLIKIRTEKKRNNADEASELYKIVIFLIRSGENITHGYESQTPIDLILKNENIVFSNEEVNELLAYLEYDIKEKIKNFENSKPLIPLELLYNPKDTFNPSMAEWVLSLLAKEGFNIINKDDLLKHKTIFDQLSPVIQKYKITIGSDKNTTEIASGNSNTLLVAQSTGLGVTSSNQDETIKNSIQDTPNENLKNENESKDFKKKSQY